MKLPVDRGGLRFYLVLLGLAAWRSSHITILWGAPFIVLGVVLHVWAKGCLRQNQEISMSGPYRFVRHPFYAANALIDAGIALMSGWWLLLVLLPVWWLGVYLPVMRREEKYLAERFPSAYEDYRRRVAALLPLRRPLPRTTAGFSWRSPNIAEGRELPRVLRLLAYPILFFILTELRTEGLVLLTDDYCFKFSAVGALAVLYGLAWELERHLKQRRRVLSAGVAAARFRGVAAAAFLGFAVAMRHLETELDLVVLPVGGAVLAFSAMLYIMRPRAALLAEGLALVGVAVLCELLWLAALPILLYSALIMDCRFATQEDLSEGGRTTSRVTRACPGIYHLVLVGGFIAVAMKEVLIG